jgi:hypothetical protein
MASKLRNLLLPFYFGAIAESDRLLVERELITDSEVLVDYLDLKRSLEAAETIPSTSGRTWSRLQSRLQPHRRLVISASLGAALAASISLAVFLHKPKTSEEPSRVHNEILFDSSSELPASSSVL